MKKAKIFINVNDNFKGSVKEAAEFCNINYTSLYAALSHKQKTFKGYNIKKLGNNQFFLETREPKLNFSTSKTKKIHKTAVPVKCLETNTIYPSINAAAKSCNEHMWTMSVKMEETGKFIDKAGNTYIRLAPMIKRTNHTYGTKFSGITREIKPYTKNNKIENTNSISNVPANTTRNEIINNLVKSATLLTANKNYTEAAQVLTILSTFDK